MPFMLLISSLELGCDRPGTVSKCGILVMQVLRGAEQIPAEHDEGMDANVFISQGTLI